jgi:hypothetical protein
MDSAFVNPIWKTCSICMLPETEKELVGMTFYVDAQCKGDSVDDKLVCGTCKKQVNHRCPRCRDDPVWQMVGVCVGIEESDKWLVDLTPDKLFSEWLKVLPLLEKRACWGLLRELLTNENGKVFCMQWLSKPSRYVFLPKTVAVGLAQEMEDFLWGIHETVMRFIPSASEFADTHFILEQELALFSTLMSLSESSSEALNFKRRTWDGIKWEWSLHKDGIQRLTQKLINSNWSAVVYSVCSRVQSLFNSERIKDALDVLDLLQGNPSVAFDTLSHGKLEGTLEKLAIYCLRSPLPQCNSLNTLTLRKIGIYSHNLRRRIYDDLKLVLESPTIMLERHFRMSLSIYLGKMWQFIPNDWEPSFYDPIWDIRDAIFRYRGSYLDFTAYTSKWSLKDCAGYPLEPLIEQLVRTIKFGGGQAKTFFLMFRTTCCDTVKRSVMEQTFDREEWLTDAIKNRLSVVQAYVSVFGEDRVKSNPEWVSVKQQQKEKRQLRRKDTIAAKPSDAPPSVTRERDSEPRDADRERAIEDLD